MMQHYTFVPILLLSWIHRVVSVHPLERDVTRLTGTELPKRWLIFVENRARKCMLNIYSDNVFNYLHCLATKYQERARCHRGVTITYGLNKIGMFTSKGSIKFRYRKTSKECLKERLMVSNIHVHKLFLVNITFQNFEVYVKGLIPPFENNCLKTQFSLDVIINGATYKYCGKRMPWSLYSNNNMAMVRIINPPVTTNFVLSVNIELGVLDNFNSTPNSSPFHGGPTVWGYFNVHTYHVTVAMLYSIRVTAPSELQNGSTIAIYDGPNEQMPQLSYLTSPQFTNIYISSTFQIFVLYVYQKKIHYELQYSADNSSLPLSLMLGENLIINNNNYTAIAVESYMRMFVISAIHNTHPRIKIRDFGVTGPFRRIFIFAGVAIYNVINGTSLLIAHWCDTLSSKEGNITITGSENNLVVVVYSYPPLACLSVSVEIDHDVCIGRFTGMETSMQLKLNTTFTNECTSIHVIKLPQEAVVFVDFVLPFDYHQVWHIHATQFYYSFSPWTHEIEVFGDVIMGKGQHMSRDTRQTTESDARGILDVIGNIQKITIHEWSPVRFSVLVAIPTSCTQPCEIMGIFLRSTEILGPNCNLCRYLWFGEFSNNKRYYTIPNTTWTFERVYGKGSFCFRLCSLVPATCGGGHQVSYCMDKDRIDVKIIDHRAMKVHVKPRQLWRVSKTIKGAFHYQWGCRSHHITHDIMFRRGLYEYILSRHHIGTPVVNLDWLRAFWGCQRIKAHLLTIHDNNELKFILRDIMEPNKIDLAFLGMWQAVGKS